MPKVSKEQKVEVAKALLPIYNNWHKACVINPEATSTKTFEVALWREALKHEGMGIPTTIEASVGRWIAKTLGMSWRPFEGII